MSLYKKDDNKIINNAFGGSSNAQKPILRDDTAFFSHATCPNKETHNKRPSYVLVNTDGVYGFCYDSGSESTAASYITGSVVQSANAGPIRLDIQPTAWTQIGGAGAIGDVTFVYVRVS